MSSIPEVRKILLLADEFIKKGEVEDGRKLLNLAFVKSFRHRDPRRPNHSAPLTPWVKASMRRMARQNPNMGLELIARMHQQNIGRAYEALHEENE
jgi:hypothetical protein